MSGETEAQTPSERIDPKLNAAGWEIAQFTSEAEAAAKT